jgi:hypothetical protein
MAFKNEMMNLELMKKRFGDKKLHNCEVMLIDIQNSERINKAVQ